MRNRRSRATDWEAKEVHAGRGIVKAEDRTWNHRSRVLDGEATENILPKGGVDI